MQSSPEVIIVDDEDVPVVVVKDDDADGDDQALTTSLESSPPSSTVLARSNSSTPALEARLQRALDSGNQDAVLDALNRLENRKVSKADLTDLELARRLQQEEEHAKHDRELAQRLQEAERQQLEHAKNESRKAQEQADRDAAMRLQEDEHRSMYSAMDRYRDSSGVARVRGIGHGRDEISPHTRSRSTVSNSGRHQARDRGRGRSLMSDPQYQLYPGFDHRHHGFGFPPRDEAGLDVDNMDYEEMLALGERIGDVRQKGASQSEIGRLPTQTYQAPPPSSKPPQSCNICLEGFKSSEKLRTLPCLHLFHLSCVDRWLAINKECPVCRISITSSSS